MTIRLLNSTGSSLFRAGLSIFLLLILHDTIATSTNLSSNYVEIKGWVLKNNKPLPNTDIIILENDTIVYQLKSNFSGAFSLIVPFQKEYIFAFSKKDLISKKVFIYTKTPSDVDPTNYYDFHFEVELFEDNPSLNKDFFNYPVSMVFYDEKIDEFNYFKANTDQLASGDKNIFKELLEKDFQYPESFLDYVQAVMDEERDRLEKKNQEPLVENVQENESETIVIQTSEPEINPETTVTDTSHLAMNIPPDKTVLETFTHDTIAETDSSLVNHDAADEPQTTTEPNDAPELVNNSSYPIDFKNYYTPDITPDFSGNIFFSIQILATIKKVPECFFCKIQESLPEKDIYHYLDKDSLDKFIVGAYQNLDATLQNFWQIRQLGYEAYVVAFHNNQRIRVKEAQTLLDNLAEKP